VNAVSEKRKALIIDLFPSGIPRLWCPLLTHYTSDGGIDFNRMQIHFRHLIPWVGGFLIPGSTGDGWELTEEETLKVTVFAMEQARSYKISLLIGVLKADVEAMKQTISRLITSIQKNSAAEQNTRELLKANFVCGFTVCPPLGSSLKQSEIEAGLSAILDMGMPTALYQLPQMTENELAPETFERLAEKYSNLVFFKDSSGGDSIATSNVHRGGVFLVRGAEGDYAQWLVDAAGGCYNGFLLSTANCFAQYLSSLIKNLEVKNQKNAVAISKRLTAVVGKVFSLVQSLPYGNPFTNANKSIDHFFAFGPSADAIEGPLIHERIRIPQHVIRATGAILTHYHLMPANGYLAGSTPS